MSILKIEVAGSPEIAVLTYQTTHTASHPRTH